MLLIMSFRHKKIGEKLCVQCLSMLKTNYFKTSPVFNLENSSTTKIVLHQMFQINSIYTYISFPIILCFNRVYMYT